MEDLDAKRIAVRFLATAVLKIRVTHMASKVVRFTNGSEQLLSAYSYLLESNMLTKIFLRGIMTFVNICAEGR